jgi:predicted lipoprotein
MSAEGSARLPRRRRVSLRAVGIAVGVLVIAAMALDTTYKDADAPKPTAGGRAAFEPAQYGAKTYPKVVATLEQNAQPLPQLVAAMRKDPEAAGKQYGHREGNSPYSFATRGEGIAGATKAGLMEVRVPGVPKSTRVSIQVGPALNGTALRDAVGFISFNQFVNQVDFADAGTALNNQVKAKVLKAADAQDMTGKRVAFTGAFTALTPSVVTITPVKLEAGS